MAYFECPALHYSRCYRNQHAIHRAKKNYLLVVGFARAVKWHNIAVILLIFSYILFVTGDILTKNGNYYRIEKQNFLSDLWKQMKYYTIGIFKKEKHPFPVTEKHKFNPLQKFTYVLAMFIAMPLLIISGIGLLLPEITSTSSLESAG